MRAKKPILVKVGKHLIEPGDVSSVSRVRRGLYIIRLKSQPNLTYPLWASGAEVQPLVNLFQILNEDGVEDLDDPVAEPEPY